MKRIGLYLTVVCLMLAAVMPVTSQTNEPDPSPLLDMLALVPDNLSASKGWSTVTYIDFQALYRAEGIDVLRRAVDLPTLLRMVPLPGMLSRLAAGPEALQYVFAAAERMPDVVGFGWVPDVDQSLEFGALPNTGLILRGNFDEAAVAGALGTRGFERADVSGVPVWHRFEDAQMSIPDRETADPFGGHVGMAVRIAIMPNYLANSRYWSIIEDIIATAQHTQGALADNPDYRALAEAVSAPDGLLLQALFFSPLDVGIVFENALSRLADQGINDPTEAYGALLPYTLAVLADHQEGNDQVHLVGLVYPDVAQAEVAAEEMAARIIIFSLLPQSDEVLVERFGAQVTASVYDSTTTGNAVAVVEVRYALPSDRIDQESGRFITGGLLYRAWVNAIMQRTFFPLVIQAE